MKESMLNKFDNVTFKTIQKENRINPNDVEKFIMNFDKTSLNK